METIELSADGTTFLSNGKKLFDKKFLQALKFHSPGLAPVCDETGWYHINADGAPLYKARYDKAFGFYCNRAAVVNNQNWFHIDIKGKRISEKDFAWGGNYQQDLCTVRDFQNNYFHINSLGNRVYDENYLYAGDFKEGYACVKTEKGWKHINKEGKGIGNHYFTDLGVFHKGVATAKDKIGWFHIDKNGGELYPQRYHSAEPFYNGFSLVEDIYGVKYVIDERGTQILKI